MGGIEDRSGFLVAQDHGGLEGRKDLKLDLFMMITGEEGVQRFDVVMMQVGTLPSSALSFRELGTGSTAISA